VKHDWSGGTKGDHECVRCGAWSAGYRPASSLSQQGCPGPEGGYFPIPRRNIHWLELKERPEPEIEERSSIFIAYCGGLPAAVVNWSSRDAIEAQRWLKAKAFARCCHSDCGIRVSQLGDSCGNHEEDRP
jgi:hypothetical protein